MADAPYARILVPLDFSDHARRALEEAVRFARACGARLRLIHAYQLPMVPPGAGATAAGAPGAMTVPNLDGSLREASVEALEREAEAVRDAGVEVDVEVGTGPPASCIAEAARAWPADLIVMGTRGASGLAHVLLGSVAERTIRNAPCPVLTVRAEDEE
ncbi:MAG: universal stress protein [Myxococcota bacterium]|nr:universal stress protein [Myxococcota bacterium]